MSPCTRFGLFALAVIGLPACGLVFPPPAACPNLDEVCPDVVCEDYAQNRDGCSICECEGADTQGAVCWDAADCSAGQRCDVVNFCEPAPSCADDGPCPDACYGRCVEAPSPCVNDADCPAGQICSFFANERPDSGDSDGGSSDPAPGAPEPAPVASGVCLDPSCGGADVLLPECPPGSELFFKDEACAPICLPVDRCRELLPEECSAARGCQLVDEGCACEEQDVCDCASIERCVAIDDCSSLPVDQCESNANCVLKAIGDGGGGVGGGSPGEDQPEPPCDCDPNQPDCSCDGGGGAPPPPDELVCVSRGFDGTCLSDADCNIDEICELSTVCGSGCTVDDDGEEHCFEECWTERGLCIPSARTCFELGPDECLADPRCELADDAGVPCFCDDDDDNCAPCVSASSCRPREGACLGDVDCTDGQHCEITEICPSCDPSSGNDIDCLAPCFVEGSCVDGAPPPLPCDTDAECAIGSSCVPVVVCEACDQGSSDGDADPAPCESVCREEKLCLQTDPVCFSDSDCAATELCDFSQLGCGFPGGLVPQCPGLCVARAAPALCQQDGQCDPGLRCATEYDHCLMNPEEPNTGCWTICVDDSAVDGAYCLSDDECTTSTGANAQCTFQADVCLDDPSSPLAICSGWCTGICAEVETPAVDPSTGQCAVFPNSCIPPGWEVVEGC
jgi:hypothetical protein